MITNLPCVISQRSEERLLSLEETLSKVHFGCWELPFMSKFVLDKQVDSIFACIVEAFLILNLRINMGEVLGGCAVGDFFIGLWVNHLVGWVIVQVHFASLSIIVHELFVKLRCFFNLIYINSLIHVVLIEEHVLVAIELEISVTHVQE